MIPQVKELLDSLGIKQYQGTTSHKFGWNGMPYVTLTQGGIKKECEPDSLLALTESDVVAAYLEQLQAFCAGKLLTQEQIQDGYIPGPFVVVVWRQQPLLEKSTREYALGKKVVEWRVYSRLVGLRAEDMKELP